MLKRNNSSLKKRAEENLNVQTKTGVSKRGLVASTPEKVGRPILSGRFVGVAKGVTLNMENYESLRIDVWVSDEVRKDETIEQAVDRLGDILSEVLENEIGKETSMDE